MNPVRMMSLIRDDLDDRRLEIAVRLRVAILLRVAFSLIS